MARTNGEKLDLNREIQQYTDINLMKIELKISTPMMELKNGVTILILMRIKGGMLLFSSH